MAGSIGYWADITKHDGDISYFMKSDGSGIDEAMGHIYQESEKTKYTRIASPPTGVDKGKALRSRHAHVTAGFFNANAPANTKDRHGR